MAHIFTRSCLILTGLMLTACGGANNSTPAPPPPPVNQAPTATITASATEVDERQSFELSAQNSSDPEGATLTYAWSQTAGAQVTIADATAQTLNLTMPETTADDTLMFTLQVSDGTLTNSTSVNVVNKNIVMTPANTEFQKRVYPGFDSLKMPQATLAYQKVFPLDSFCDSGNSSSNETRVLGKDALDVSNLFSWSEPSKTYDDAPDETIVSNSTVTSNSWMKLLKKTYDGGCIDFFNPGPTFRSTVEYFDIGVFGADGKVVNLSTDDVLFEEPDICAVDYGFRTPRGIVTGSRSNGIQFREDSSSGSILNLSPAETLVTGGEYCDFIFKTIGGGLSGIFAIDLSDRTLVQFNQQGGGSAAVTEVLRQTFDTSGSEALMVMGTGFFDEGQTAAILVSDGNHGGDHRLLLHTVKNENFVNGGFELTATLTLPGGVPNKVFIFRNYILVTSSTSPYVAVFTCDFDELATCSNNDVSFIEVGFDVSDVSNDITFIVNQGNRQRFLVTRPDANEVVVFQKNP